MMALVEGAAEESILQEYADDLIKLILAKRGFLSRLNEDDLSEYLAEEIEILRQEKERRLRRLYD